MVDLSNKAKAAIAIGGGLVGFALLRRLSFKVKKRTELQKSKLPARPSVKPKGPAWLIHKSTIKLAPELTRARGLEKTLSLGKGGLIKASTVKGALEFSSASAHPGFLGALVSWGQAMQSWHVDRMARLNQYTAYDRSETGGGLLLFDRKSGEPKNIYPLYSNRKISGQDLPNLDYLVGWPASPGMVWAAPALADRYSHVVRGTESILTPQFGFPCKGGVGYFLNHTYWLDNYGYDSKGRSEVGEIEWSKSWIGRSFQFHKYPAQRNLGDVGRVKLGGKHNRVGDFQTLTPLGGRGLTSWGAWDGYFYRSQWLVWAAEWYRISEVFRYIWMIGRLPAYPVAPKWWRDHCLSWGIGVPDKWRWKNCYHPAWSGMVPPPGIWGGTTEGMLKQVMQWTPRPGSMPDSKTGRDTTLDWVSRFPGVDWPNSAGPMQPLWSLPYNYSNIISESRRSEHQRQFDRAKLVVEVVRSVASIFTGDASVAEKVLDAAETVVKTLDGFGASLGPIMAIFGAARVFTGGDITRDIFGDNPALKLNEALRFIEQGVESRAEAYLDEIQAYSDNISGKWPHMSGLLGKVQDLKPDLRKGYDDLYRP